MITPDEYNAFVVEWHAGFYRHQRFGQAFINKFIAEEAGASSTSKLFYEDSLVKAKELAWIMHVDAHGAMSAGE